MLNLVVGRLHQSHRHPAPLHTEGAQDWGIPGGPVEGQVGGGDHGHGGLGGQGPDQGEGDCGAGLWQDAHSFHGAFYWRQHWQDDCQGLTLSYEILSLIRKLMLKFIFYVISNLEMNKRILL